MNADQLKGHLDLLLLSILGAGPLHGYAIIEELRRRSEGALALPEGTVYPALHRLERLGHLSSRWSDATGRRRREYTLSDSGREALRTKAAEWHAFAGAIESVIRRMPWPIPA